MSDERKSASGLGEVLLELADAMEAAGLDMPLEVETEGPPHTITSLNLIRNIAEELQAREKGEQFPNAPADPTIETMGLADLAAFLKVIARGMEREGVSVPVRQGENTFTGLDMLYKIADSTLSWWRHYEGQRGGDGKLGPLQ